MSQCIKQLALLNNKNILISLNKNLIKRTFIKSQNLMNRRIPYDLEPIDLKLNDKIEQIFYDENKQIDCFLKRMNIDLKYNDEILKITETNMFHELQYIKKQRNSLKGYFLTQMYLAETIDKFYKSKIPARLSKILIEFLMSRESISSSSNYIGLSDLLIHKNDYFKLKNLSDIEFKSEDKILETLNINDNDLAQYKHTHIDDLDIICDKFYEFIDFCNNIWNHDEMILFFKNFVLPNISAFDWISKICNNFSTAMEYICFIIKFDNPNANVQFKLTKNPNPVFNFIIFDYCFRN